MYITSFGFIRLFRKHIHTCMYRISSALKVLQPLAWSISIVMHGQMTLLILYKHVISAALSVLRPYYLFW